MSTSSFDLTEKVKQVLGSLLTGDPSETAKSETPELQNEPAPPPQPLPPYGSQVLARAKLHLAKRQAQKAYDEFVAKSGPQAEYHSRLYAQSVLVPVATILDDPEFKNLRRSMDPYKLTELQESIALEGLKVPIVVIESPIPGYYHVRAGFRRVVAIRNLKWEHIAAIVLPADTPEIEEYWINIIENTAREKLSTYELASAAKLMRDRFNVSPANFAKKAGHSLDYIQDLLLCIDRLPLEVVENWRNGAKLPLRILVKLSTLTTTEAVRNCRLWLGQHRIDPAEALKRLERKPEKSNRLWSNKGIERLQRLHMAIKISSLPAETKRVCIDLVEYLQGVRKHIPGLIKDRTIDTDKTQQVDEGDLIKPSLTMDSNINHPNEVNPQR